MKKNIYYIALPLVFITLISLLISIYIFNKNHSVRVPQKIESTKITPSLQWDLYIPEIKKSIGSHFMGVKVYRIQAKSIHITEDVTGDGVPEALVAIDNQEPEATRFALIYIDKQGYIRPAVFQYKTGSIGDILFLGESTELAGMHTILSSTTKSMISMHWNIDAFDSSKLECELETYTWNASASMFIFNFKESYFAKTPICESILKNR